jgi:hypothetical protein
LNIAWKDKEGYLMSTNNQNPQDEPFSKEQEVLIKQSIEDFEKRLGITKETPEYLKQSFERKLTTLSQPKKSFALRWRGFTTLMVTAFSAGILITRFLMMPTTVATRGIGDDNVAHQISSAQEYVSLQVVNPKEFVFEVISAALEADMEVEATQAGGKYGLYIKPFKANVKDQEKVKTLLGVKSETVGTVNATIGQSKN